MKLTFGSILSYVWKSSLFTVTLKTFRCKQILNTFKHANFKLTLKALRLGTQTLYRFTLNPLNQNKNIVDTFCLHLLQNRKYSTFGITLRPSLFILFHYTFPFVFTTVRAVDQPVRRVQYFQFVPIKRTLKKRS